MAIVRISMVPEDRRAISTEVEIHVRGFRGATAVVAKDMRQNCDSDFRNRVMRLWAQSKNAGGFAIRNSRYAHCDEWVLFEYVEGN